MLFIKGEFIMKKRMISLSLALCLALCLAIPAGAAVTEKNVISAEQYQEYIEIAKRVSQQTGVDVTVRPISEITNVYTANEFELELLDFCNVVAQVQNSST